MARRSTVGNKTRMKAMGLDKGIAGEAGRMETALVGIGSR